MVRTWIQANEDEMLEGFFRVLRQVAEREVSAQPVTIDPASTVAIFHTSGTSGFPKGAALSLGGSSGLAGFPRLVATSKQTAPMLAWRNNLLDFTSLILRYWVFVMERLSN